MCWPKTSSISAFQITSILGCLNSRSCRMRSARNSSRRWTTVTLDGEIGEEQRLLDGGVAAADHHALPCRDRRSRRRWRRRRRRSPGTSASRRQAQPARLGAGGDDHRVGGVDRAAIAGEHERAPVEIDLDDDVVDDLGADMLGLRLHLLHQPGALDDVGEAGIVLDIGGDGELAARLEAGDHHAARAWRAPHRWRRCSRPDPTR